MLTFKVKALTENCAPVTEKIIGLLEENGFDSPALHMKIELVVEEIFVNIASYAYKDTEGGDALVEADISGDPAALTIAFTDSGVPFDPLAKEDPDVTLSADERGIGGLGIYLVKKNMDDVKYERCGNKNVLTVKKVLGSK